MVVFTCQHCGESIQKPKVEKHYLTKCRHKKYSLTCVDCLKDFIGDEYSSHTQCVSEAQRYAPKGTVIKEGKGKNKQARYVELIQDLLNSKNLSNVQRQLLQICSNFDNVPRKQKKFQNFMMNVAKRVKYTDDDLNSVFKLLEETWRNETTPKGDQTANKEILSSKLQENNNNEEKNIDTNGYLQSNGEESKVKKKKVIDENETLNIKENSVLEDCHSDEKPTESMNKMLKKEMKKKKKYEKYLAELEDQTKCAKENIEQEESIDDSNIVNKKKKSKKSKGQKNTLFPSCNGNDNEEALGAELEGVSYEKKTKRKHDGEICQTPDKKKRKVQQNDVETDQLQGAFDWADVIIRVLQAHSDKELSLKRLGKKVVNEYLTVKPDHRTYDDLLARFNKKVHKTPGVKVLKDRAKLCT